MGNGYQLRMTDITKSFYGVEVLHHVDLHVRKGEIHALIGENGAGKSTLMKILSGAYQKDSGEIYLADTLIEVDSPKKGIQLGIGIIYQELELAEELTVAENIFLDQIGEGSLFVNWKKLKQKAEKVLAELDLHIDVNREIKQYNIAYQQIVEIAKAISKDIKILILDEPTSSLAPKEVELLFKILDKLKNRGVSIIYISHRMEEIFRICDSFTTLRDGKVTGEGRVADYTIENIVELMIGRSLNEMFPERLQHQIGKEIFRIENFNSPKFKDINLTVREGELLGISGLIGSGRTEVARAVFGIDKKNNRERLYSGAEN